MYLAVLQFDTCRIESFLPVFYLLGSCFVGFGMGQKYSVFPPRVVVFYRFFTTYILLNVNWFICFLISPFEPCFFLFSEALQGAEL